MKLFADNHGQGLVELAVVLPVLVLLLFGAAEYGRLSYVGVEVTNAAYAGAIYGSQNHATASDDTGMAAAATNEGANLAAMDSHWLTSGVATQHLCASSYNATPSPCSDSSSPIEYVKVNTHATVASLFNFPGFPSSYVLQGQALIRVRE
jgi:Flp pilus assembly protein TadG